MGACDIKLKAVWAGISAEGVEEDRKSDSFHIGPLLLIYKRSELIAISYHHNGLPTRDACFNLVIGVARRAAGRMHSGAEHEIDHVETNWSMSRGDISLWFFHF